MLSENNDGGSSDTDIIDPGGNASETESGGGDGEHNSPEAGESTQGEDHRTFSIPKYSNKRKRYERTERNDSDAVAENKAIPISNECSIGAAKYSDIRAVFAVNLISVDDSELRLAYRDRDTFKEKLKASEKENEILRMQLEQLKRFQPMKVGSVMKCTMTVSLCSQKKSVRVGSGSLFNPTLVYVAHSMENMHGITKTDLERRASRVFVPLHSATIRDFKVRRWSGANDLILSTGIDKTVKLFSGKTDTFDLSINLPFPGWSCAFDQIHDEIFYVGAGNKSVIQIFDIRKPNEPLKEIANPNMGKMGFGVHSLQHVGILNCLVGGSLATPFLVQNQTANQTISTTDSLESVPLFKGGNICISVDFNEEKNRLLTSWRCDEKINHVIGSFDIPTVISSNDNFPTFNHIAEFETKLHTNLSRSRCFTKNGQSVFATGSDFDGAAFLHAVNDDGVVHVVQKLGGVETGARVMDVLGIGNGDSTVVLTDSKAHVWN
ncbi:RING finger and WD repeat domain-containing protein 3 [Physocladia obscura]|uniref:RING-type E3 ubiquitin transferase n=1 Tax=Physocladia obscura TaxID=109957 RepID=A0AAD5TA42_9FUNG|nr:RING finger and WD repeat domain-containing protein 3 [Physocladia obscura]